MKKVTTQQSIATTRTHGVMRALFKADVRALLCHCCENWFHKPLSKQCLKMFWEPITFRRNKFVCMEKAKLPWMPEAFSRSYSRHITPLLCFLHLHREKRVSLAASPLVAGLRPRSLLSADKSPRQACRERTSGTQGKAK